MRRLLPLLFVLALAAPAHAGVPTLGAHNTITVDGYGAFDVHIDREVRFQHWQPGEGEPPEFFWRIGSDRPDAFKAIVIRQYGGVRKVIASGYYGTALNASGADLPAGDYRVYVASPDGPSTLTVDVGGLSGDRAFAATQPTPGGRRSLTRIQDDGWNEVYGASLRLDHPGWMFAELRADDEWLVERAGGCVTLGAATEPTAEDYGPSCPERETYLSPNQGTSFLREVRAGWSGYGTWVQGIGSDPATRSGTLVWLADALPAGGPTWPAEPAPAVAPAPQAAPQQPKVKPKKKQKRKNKRRAARRRG